MASSPRIPRSIAPFNDYINTIVNYTLTGTPTNGDRLGLEKDEQLRMKEICDNWNTTWKLYADRSAGRTIAVTASMNGYITDFIDYNESHHLLDRIASSLNATELDYQIFNISVRKTITKGQTKSISAAVQPIIQPIGGGTVSIKCYSDESARPSVYSQANCVQFAFIVGNTAPLSPIDENIKYDTSTRASFNFEAGADKVGKQLFIFFRWYNTVHPDIAGPWSALNTVWLS